MEKYNPDAFYFTAKGWQWVEKMDLPAVIIEYEHMTRYNIDLDTFWKWEERRSEAGDTVCDNWEDVNNRCISVVRFE